MKAVKLRRLAQACVASAVVAGALAAPGTASASLGTECSGVDITGQGASVLSLAMHNVFIPGFETSADKYACDGSQGSGGTPTVTYTNSGSGAGLESWGVNKKVTPNYSSTNAYVGTSEAPNLTQKGEIEANETTMTPSTLQTVPVAQFADTIIVNLPTNCKATSTSNKGRLVLNNATLEGIWRGTITKWSQITEGGDKLSGTGCNPETGIAHVVREDASGPAHFLKKYLYLINKATYENEAGETVTWDQSSEGKLNTVWPKAIGAIKTTEKGEAAEDKLVSETPGSIGFGNLAEIRSGGLFSPSPGTGGPNTARFWVPIQNKEGSSVTYADPASNKDVAKLGEANCTKEEYTNGTTAFPPSSVTEPWNEVTTKTSEPKYTLCGFVFALALDKYSVYPSTTLQEATTVENFLSYALDTTKEKSGNNQNGGQTLLKNHDYEPLSGTVLKEAQNGVRKGTGF